MFEWMRQPGAGGDDGNSCEMPTTGRDRDDGTVDVAQTMVNSEGGGKENVSEKQKLCRDVDVNVGTVESVMVGGHSGGDDNETLLWCDD